MNNKTESLKEKLRQALSSTARVISDDLGINPKKNNKNSEKQDLIELENLNSKNDFIKARAETDSKALKKKFSNESIFKKNLPSSSSCKSLYTITEKIRYEKLGSKMLKFYWDSWCLVKNHFFGKMMLRNPSGPNLN